MDYHKAGFNIQVDGDKFICMDRISLEPSSCIIYSFGVNHDWTFEDHMDHMGCSIYAYDHTIDAPAVRGKNIQFFKLGLGTQENMNTLDNIIQDNGHSGATIEYLKVIFISSTAEFSQTDPIWSTTQFSCLESRFG